MCAGHADGCDLNLIHFLFSFLHQSRENSYPYRPESTSSVKLHNILEKTMKNRMLVVFFLILAASFWVPLSIDIRLSEISLSSKRFSVPYFANIAATFEKNAYAQPRVGNNANVVKASPLEITEIIPSTLKHDITIPDIILVPAKNGELGLLLSPYINLMKKNNTPPMLLALQRYGFEGIHEFLTTKQDQQILSLVESKIVENYFSVDSANIEVIDSNVSSVETAITLAKTFLKNSPEIILSSVNSPTHFLQASTLAAHFRLPLIPFDNMDFHALRNLVNQIGVRKIYVIADSKPIILQELAEIKVTKLEISQIQELLHLKIGREKIRNIILTSLPQEEDPRRIYNQPVSYAPYISLLRSAPIVFTSSNSGIVAEQDLFSYIHRFNLQPQTITILADYEKIETIEIDDQLKNTVYNADMQLEPGSGPQGGDALPFGVGRLPFRKLSALSLFYAKVQDRQRMYQDVHPEFIMISNLKEWDEYGLPLAETISRATVNELRNFKLKGKEFYRKVFKNKINEAAVKTGLIIFEGHNDTLDALDYREKNGTYIPANYVNNPFLILQSCNSLGDAETIFEQGAIGMIGSSTRVHSASGSSLIKAYLDSILYQNATVGEALREAKNYFLAITQLKAARGHQEQNKTFRAALTFRLWGDPEMRLFSKQLRPPVKPGITAKALDSKTIEISTPDKSYRKLASRFYVLKHFPNAQTAGFVTRYKNKEKKQRKVNSFYFSKIPIKEPLQLDMDFVLHNKDIADVRNISLLDPFQRWMYVLHYPKKMIKNEKLLLRFE